MICRICHKIKTDNTSGICWRCFIFIKDIQERSLEELLDFLPAGFEKNEVGNEKYCLTIMKTPEHLIGFMDNKRWEVSYSTPDGLELLNGDCFFEDNNLRVALENLIEKLKELN